MSHYLLVRAWINLAIRVRTFVKGSLRSIYDCQFYKPLFWFTYFLMLKWQWIGEGGYRPVLYMNHVWFGASVGNSCFSVSLRVLSVINMFFLPCLVIKPSQESVMLWLCFVDAVTKNNVIVCTSLLGILLSFTCPREIISGPHFTFKHVYSGQWITWAFSL